MVIAGPRPVSLQAAKKWLYNSIVPTTMETSTSKDYVATRRWLVVHDYAMGVGNFAVGSAMGEALGWNPTWSGAGMNLFNQIKGKMCETAGFATNYAAPAADKNPRPWLVAGTLGDTAGMVVESCSNLVPGGALLSFSGGAAIFRVFTGCMKGAGWGCNSCGTSSERGCSSRWLIWPALMPETRLRIFIPCGAK
jgi:hypothetical protein